MKDGTHDGNTNSRRHLGESAGPFDRQVRPNSKTDAVDQPASISDTTWDGSVSAVGRPSSHSHSIFSHTRWSEISPVPRAIATADEVDNRR